VGVPWSQANARCRDAYEDERPGGDPQASRASDGNILWPMLETSRPQPHGDGEKDYTTPFGRHCGGFFTRECLVEGGVVVWKRIKGRGA